MKHNQKRSLIFGLILAGILLAAAAAFLLLKRPPSFGFNGERAYQDVITQVDFGPRIPGSQAHAQTVDWIVAQLQSAGWQAKVLEQSINGVTVRNIVARRSGAGKFILLGAHYDSRQFADQDVDPQKQTAAVPGANDGASGVAVLLELARSLPAESDKEIWLVFFDLEDQGGIDGQNWIVGSTAFAQSLERNPDAVVIVDMIGDADLNVYYERNSDPTLSTQIWQTAAGLGYGRSLIQQPKFSMLDDHTPFAQRGIPAVDLIDFDYPHWHTTGDTADKVSAESLLIIGQTLWTWLQ